MAKPFHWDFEARNVAFKLRVQASVHPSLTACTVSIPFLDANGALTSTISASLDQGEVVQRQAAPRAAQFINLEKEIGAFNVSLDLVKGIQKAKLPISVTLDGAQQVVSEARICLGPLLLAGSPALSPETYRPGEPARSMRLRPTHSVSATFTESVGVAGLYSLEVSVITDKPMLSLEMMTRLMPACFRVEVLRGLPNEKSLPEQCEEVFVDVYPRLSSCSEALRETCPRMQSERRPHNKGADFIEPIVWLLGLAPPHAVREWMQHEGLVVEVHDRDPKLQGAAGTDPDKKKPIHGHGVVRFPLGPLLELETLELALRGDLVPCRGDKKQRRAEALSNDSLHAAGLLDEEGRQKMARRQGLDKREDTTDYHTLGTVCTLRAALAVPVPRHFKIQEEEEKVHRKHWESTEHVLDGHVFTAKTLGTSPKGHEKSPTATPTKWAPKAVPCRAKIGEVVGPWRRNQEEAEEDEELLQAADNLEHTQAIAHELIEAAPTGASGGLDCRFERYGRIFMVCAEGSDGEVTRAVLNCMHELNAELLGLNPEEAEFKLRQLSEEEQEDPHLDVLTGFCILDGRSRHFVIEGLREGLSWPKLLEVIPRGPDAPKLLHNSNIGFGERLYASFGPQLKQVKIRSTLEKLAGRSSLYSWNPSVTEADAGANEAPKQLMALKGLERLRGAREDSHWPRAAQIKRLQLLYGAFLSDQELEGYAAEEDVKVKKMKRNLDRRGSTCIDRRRSAFLEAQKSVVLDARKSVAVGTEKGVLQEALAEDLTNAGTLRFQTRSTLKKPLDQTNDPYEQHTELKKTASMPNFLKTNKEQVREKSEANTRTFNYLGKKRDRETPFLEGAPNGEVYLYSSQKFNCTELQKDWMRKKMAGKDSEKYWSYNELYMSQNFDFAGAAPPGVPQLFPPRPNDTYARLESDNRPIFRGIHPRPKEAYRKPPRDVDPSRAELLHEPFEEAEWFRVAMGEDRAKPVRVEEAFEPYKVPHQRRYTENPFDAQHILMGEHHDFGPKSGFESVHYHGRAPGEGVEDTYLEPNVKEMEAAKSKIRFHHEMRFWSQCISRTGVTDLDRHELVLKDNPTLPLRGRVDEPLPESMRTMEVFHDAGRPDLEWHARLRENDSSAPIDVNTGAHIKRDHEVGFKKRACMSGKLTKAPWLHQSTLTLGKSKSAKSVTYMSTKDFAAFTRPPKSKFCEDQLWKNASRSVIKPSERESLPYKRPHHYGVHL